MSEQLGHRAMSSPCASSACGGLTARASVARQWDGTPLCPRETAHAYLGYLELVAARARVDVRVERVVPHKVLDLDLVVEDRHGRPAGWGGAQCPQE